MRTCSESLSRSLFFFFFEKTKQRKWWRWEIICVLCSAQSSKPFCVLPGTGPAESKWSKSGSKSVSVSINWALMAHLAVVQCEIPATHWDWTEPLAHSGISGFTLGQRLMKISHTNYYFVLCHLDSLRCWPIVKQLMSLSSLSKLILPRPWAAQIKTRHFCSIKAAAQPTQL